MPWRAACLAGKLGHKLSGLLPLEAAPVLLIEEADQLLVVGAPSWAVVRRLVKYDRLELPALPALENFSLCSVEAR